MSDTASISSYATGGTAAAVGGFIQNEWIAVAGLFFVAATFGVNWYYKHKTLKITQKQHAHGHGVVHK